MQMITTDTHYPLFTKGLLGSCFTCSEHWTHLLAVVRLSSRQVVVACLLVAVGSLADQCTFLHSMND